MSLSIHSLYQSWQVNRQQKQHRLAQGRLTANEAATCLPLNGDIPLTKVSVSHGTMPTIFTDAANPGHLLVVAPPDGHWREQIVWTLSRWSGAALIIDPDGQLYRQTAALRQAKVGNVFAHPGYRLPANDLLRLWQEDHAQRLHQLLLPESTDLAEETLNPTTSLFCAIGHYSLVHKMNPFQLLLDMALTDMLRALAALETVPPARLHVRHFTKGLPPHLAIFDAMTVQAFARFCQQLWPYQAAYDAFALPAAAGAILPQHWFRTKSSLYITYPGSQMPDMVGLVAALVHSQLRAHQTFGNGHRLLLIMDTRLAGRLLHFLNFLSTAADYGISVLLTAPSLAALDMIPTASGRDSFIAAFNHQLWYPPRDRETATYMATRLGTVLNKNGTPIPLETTAEVLGWPKEKLLLLTVRERPYLLVGQPVPLPTAFPQRQPPMPPTTATVPRTAAGWLPPLPEMTELVQTALVAGGTMSNPDEVPTAPATTGAEDGLLTTDSSEPADGQGDHSPDTATEDASQEQRLHLVRTRFR